MYRLKYDPDVCRQCETLDCLTKCQYLDFDLAEAKKEKMHLLEGEDSRVLTDCLTCYACEEYCPNSNHPFYLIVDRQEEKGILPVPTPLTKQQLIMMGPKGTLIPSKVTPPVINMCFFSMLTGNIRGKLFEGVATISGSDLFCNAMWLHFAKNSVIQERLPTVIDSIMSCYLRESNVDELICFHDECYGTFTHLAPAYGIDVPFKPIHFFEYLSKKLETLNKDIRKINKRVAYQRPCSNRLIPETRHFVDDIFEKIGVDRVSREYDKGNALCCGGTIRIHQKEDIADDIQKRNIDDMEEAGVEYCVFNCPACLFSLGDAVSERGIIPILMSDLCQIALEQG